MLTVLLLAFAALRVQSAPLGPETAPTIVHTLIQAALFKRQAACDCSGPLERTLVDIIRGCLLTIAACVYRAIHQNIPDPKASWWTRQWIRIKITFFALMAPEAVIWWAMRQWQGAKNIANEVNKIYPDLKWTRTHGHFAQMGGFGRKDNERILHPPTLISLLKSGEVDLGDLRRVTKKRIQDQSKGDALSKLVIFLQTTWFVFECLARFQQGLPVTELEVVTLAFAALNGFMYGFWWDKPIDVLCTIYITVGVPPQHQASSSPSPDAHTLPSSDPTSEPVSSETEKLLSPSESPASSDDTAALSSMKSAWSTVEGSIRSGVGLLQESINQRGWWIVSHWFLELPAMGAFALFEGIIDTFGGLFSEHQVDVTAGHIDTFYAIEATGEEEGWIGLASGSIGIVFGAIHFLSWNAHFPTHAEQLLWRTSTVAIVSVPPFLGVLSLVGAALDDVQSRRLVWRMIHSIVEFLGMAIVVLAPIGYFLARICLLALAFLTLRNLPPPAFHAIGWTQYIPHF